MTLNELNKIIISNNINTNTTDAHVGIEKKGNSFIVYNYERGECFSIDTIQDEHIACSVYLERILGTSNIKNDHAGFKAGYMYLLWNYISNDGYLLFAIDDVSDYYINQDECLHNVVSIRFDKIDRIHKILADDCLNHYNFIHSCRMVNYYANKLYAKSICIGELTEKVLIHRENIVISDYEMENMLK